MKTIKDVIKELKEDYLGCEVGLLKLDNQMQEIGGYSIYDGDTEQYIELGEFNYWYEEYVELAITFELISKGDDKNFLDAVVRVTGIYEFLI